MTVYHKSLTADRWSQLSLCERMANVGSEVIRALNWLEKGNETYSRKASDRALELLDLSLESAESLSRTKEIARLREALVDFFYFSNRFSSSHELWRSYFNHFNYAARNRS